MKKALSLVFVLILMLGFVACKSNETGDIDTFAPNENSSGVESIALGCKLLSCALTQFPMMLNRQKNFSVQTRQKLLCLRRTWSGLRK